MTPALAEMRRPDDVVITGVGLVTPLATGTRESWEALLGSKSGTGPITRFDASRYSVSAAAQVDDLDARRFVPDSDRKRMDRYSLLGVAASILALEDAGLDPARIDPERTSVFMGVGLGGLETLENAHRALELKGPRFVTPYFIPMIIPNMAAGWISMIHGIRGKSLTASTACASGSHAIGEALQHLRRGEADMVLAGGAEAAVTPLGVAGFAAMRALSTRDVDPSRASCPFDRERDGFVIGEGAAVLVLETRGRAVHRGAHPIARLTGYGVSSDAFDLTQPDPDARGALEAMQRALSDAGLDGSDVDHVNAHATSTPLGDRVEAKALSGLLGDRRSSVPLSSTKGATGHLLGAAGALEAAFTALAVRDQVAPPTLNLLDPDPLCDLDHVIGGPRETKIRVALSNAFGFGGTNCTLVIERYQQEDV